MPGGLISRLLLFLGPVLILLGVLGFFIPQIAKAVDIHPVYAALSGIALTAFIIARQKVGSLPITAETNGTILRGTRTVATAGEPQRILAVHDLDREEGPSHWLEVETVMGRHRIGISAGHVEVNDLGRSLADFLDVPFDSTEPDPWSGLIHR